MADTPAKEEDPVLTDIDWEHLDSVLRSGLGNQEYTGCGVEKRVWDAVTDVHFYIEP